MYSFEKAIELVEEKESYSRTTRTRLAKKAGISRITLNRWFKKSKNDMDGYEERYGDVYLNMWREGMTVEMIEEVHKDKFRSPFGIFGNPIFAKGVLFISRREAPRLYRTDWFQQFKKRDLEEENRKKRDEFLKKADAMMK